MSIVISSIINHIPSIAGNDSCAWGAEGVINAVKAAYEHIVLTGDLNTVYIQIQYGVDDMPGSKNKATIGPYQKNARSIGGYLPYRKEQIDHLDLEETRHMLIRDINEMLIGIEERLQNKGLVTNLYGIKYPTYKQ